jgi:hypothetical protein
MSNKSIETTFNLQRVTIRLLRTMLECKRQCKQRILKNQAGNQENRMLGQVLFSIRLDSDRGRIYPSRGLTHSVNEPVGIWKQVLTEKVGTKAPDFKSPRACDLKLTSAEGGGCAACIEEGVSIRQPPIDPKGGGCGFTFPPNHGPP